MTRSRKYYMTQAIFSIYKSIKGKRKNPYPVKYLPLFYYYPKTLSLEILKDGSSSISPNKGPTISVLS